MFLRDWTSSLVAGLVIPVTIAVTVLTLKMIGQSFNLMTLGGLAAAIGLVIYDAIVVVENIVLHRDGGERRVEAVRNALSEIITPLIGSTITPRGCVSSLGCGQRGNRHLFSSAGYHHDRCTTDLLGAGAYLDAGAQSRASQGTVQ